MKRVSTILFIKDSLIFINRLFQENDLVNFTAYSSLILLVLTNLYFLAEILLSEKTSS